MLLGGRHFDDFVTFCWRNCGKSDAAEPHKVQILKRSSTSLLSETVQLLPSIWERKEGILIVNYIGECL